MKDKFDDLARSLAQSVTRRGALKKFGIGLSGIVLTTLGMASNARAGQCKSVGSHCTHNSQCCSGVCYSPGEDAGERVKSICA